MCSNAFYISPAPVFPNITHNVKISNVQAGALISVVLVGILAFQIPAGSVIDRTDPRKIVAASAVPGLSLLVATREY